jgi:membrane protein implicated in regulation of membrane protease activity
VNPFIVWVVAGFILVVAELVTGTFYLLVLGVAAFAGGAVAWIGGDFWAQAIVSGIGAVSGVLGVRHYRKGARSAPMRGVDVGQPANFESWIDRASGHARVKYRDTLWDAHVVGDAAGQPGEILYVVSIDGNTLKVSKTRPA